MILQERTISQVLDLRPSSTEAARRVVLQRVLLDRHQDVRDLYWRVPNSEVSGVEIEDGRLVIPEGTTVVFDGYFNAFHEFHWRANTTFDDLALRVRLDGAAHLRLLHTSISTGRRIVWEGHVDQDREIPAPPLGGHFRQWGRLWFELTAIDGAVTLVDAVWAATSRTQSRTGLALVFCTFNRERELGRILDAFAADSEAIAGITAIFVVNQGRPNLRDHPALANAVPQLNGVLRVIEQGNFGGAGGFTRGLIEALDDPRVTHACLMDDDVEVETESLLRTAAFFDVAHPGVALGGHMLDSIQPHILYEAGATIEPRNWHFRPLHAGLDLRDPRSLDALLEPAAMHYNGWWFFALPLAIVREIGLPLPCFIRGDDIEYGLRLASHGFSTATLPGVAIWHEPFYLKLGGWQLYYEVRNLLVAGALHIGFARRHVTMLVLRLMLTHLLTFRYYNVALIIRGVADFLRGPDILRGPPGAIHASLGAIKANFPVNSVSRNVVLVPHTDMPMPRGRLGFTLAMIAVLVRSALVPARVDAVPQLLEERDFAWFRMARMDGIVLNGFWDRDLPIYRRCRSTFLTLARQAVPQLLALWSRGERVAQAWREATPDLIDETRWRGTLGIDGKRDLASGVSLTKMGHDIHASEVPHAELRDDLDPGRRQA